MDETHEFITLEELGDMIEGQVHPVILSHDDEYISHHGVGTAFILEHAGELFAVSAQHVLENQRARAEDLRIRLRKAAVSVVFDRCAVFQPDCDLDSDLLILRIAEFQHDELFAAGLACVRATDCVHSDQHKNAEIFRVFGYPDVGREYDYDKQSLSAVLWSVNGVLAESSVHGLTTLQVVGSRPDKFRGMSGSMVTAEIDGEWKFAGMVTLASDTNGLLNFIPAETIVFYLDKLLLLEMTGHFVTETDAK